VAPEARLVEVERRQVVEARRQRVGRLLGLFRPEKMVTLMMMKRRNSFWKGKRVLYAKALCYLDYLTL
jgi:hypothetical protein